MSGQQRSSAWQLVVDLLLPVGLYYLLRSTGAEPVAALLISGAVPVLRLGYQLVAHRRADPITLFVIGVVVVSVLLAFVGGTPRMMLAKDALLFAACGVGVLLTLFGKPLMFTLGRMLSARAGYQDDWDAQWEASAAFRRVWQKLTVLWGVGLLVDAVVQVVLAFTLPIDVVPALSLGQWLAVLVLLQLVTQLYLRRPAIRAIIDS